MALWKPTRRQIIRAGGLIAAPAIIGRALAQVPMTGAGLAKPSSGGGASPTWAPTGNPVGQNTNTASATFSGVAIGSPASSDVIVAVFDSTALVASSITCNSVAMTKQKEESTTLSGLQIWSITATAAGVTGNATTTFVASASGNFNSQTLQVGKLTGVNPTPTATGSATTNSMSVTVPATGFAIIGGSGATVTSWSGATQDFSTSEIAGAGTLYMANATATGTVTATISGSFHMVYAAWGP